MPWVKLDDGFPFNRKAIIAGKDGRAMYVTALCWTSGQLTDGFIDDAVVPMLAAVSEVADAQATAEHLVAVGLWERTPDGYEIHDYHDYNPPSDEVKAMRKARAEAGRRGGKASAGSKSQANVQANCQANVQAKAKQNSTPSPSPSPSISPDDDEEMSSSPFLAEAIDLYHDNIGMLSSLQVDAVKAMILELEKQGLQSWWVGAIKVSVDAGVRNWRYLSAVLERCLAEGHPPGAGNGRSGSKARDAPDPKKYVSGEYAEFIQH